MSVYLENGFKDFFVLQVESLRFQEIQSRTIVLGYLAILMGGKKEGGLSSL